MHVRTRLQEVLGLRDASLCTVRGRKKNREVQNVFGTSKYIRGHQKHVWTCKKITRLLSHWRFRENLDHLKFGRLTFAKILEPQPRWEVLGMLLGASWALFARLGNSFIDYFRF